MMRARLRWVAPLAVAAALAGCGRGGKDGPPAASVAAAATLLLSDEDLLTVGAGAQAGGPVITGSLQPEKKADLRAEVSSVVLQVLKDNGEAVRAGDLLVRLDDAAIRDSLASAEEAARAAAQALEQSERTLQRLKTLQAQGMSSQQTLDDAEVRRNGAQSDLVAARARAATARQQLQRTLVRAPFDGVVGERRASAGDTAQVGKELLKVWDPRTTRFEGLVSADRLHEIRAGQKVQFRVNGYPNVEFAGTIRRVDAAANATTRQVEVLVAFADPAAAPRVAGLFAEGRIDTGAAAGLALPDAAIVRRGGATFVWRVTGDRLVESAVVLGERDARRGEWPLLSGLAAGERILRRPGAALVDGQAVELASVAPAAASAAPAPGTK